MHEEISNPRMEESSSRHGSSLSFGQSERKDSERPMGPSSNVDGERLEDTTQPSASQGKSTSRQTRDLEGTGSSRGWHSRQEKESCTKKQMARMGQQEGDGRKSVHSKKGSELGSPQGNVSVGNVLQLLEHQSYRCALTGRKLTPETAALDHIVPIRHGGEHVIENAQVLHKDANRAKGSLTADEFVQLCREVVKWDRSKKGRN